MATELAKAYVQIIPSAKGIKGKMTEELGGEASSAGKSAGLNIASSIKKAIAAAGIGAAIKAALDGGGALQQSLGGIETLFKDSSDKVIESAKNAYKTAGMSANEYMETVTSFSASLLQGLAGDTGKAADVADMALTDMSDNANKMGTSMELIQNAYQGFAKQNYTMLDNLKLGYGGTKTEMQRLLADAQKLTGVKYDLNNLSDVYEAIHVIQGELGITGTTAKEAASTLSGSMAAMKAAFTNVLGNLSLGEDIGPSLDALGETVFTFMTGNLVPMVGNILSNLPELIESGMSMAIRGLNLVANNADVLVQNGIDLIGQLVVGIVSALPYLAEAAVNIVTGLGTALINTDWIGVATGILTQLRDNLAVAAMEILGTDGSIVNSMFDGIMNQLPVISDGITSTFQFLWDTCNNIWIAAGQPIYDAIMSAFQFLWETCSNIWSMAGQPIWDAIMTTIKYVSDNWGSISDSISTYFQVVCDYWQTVWTNIGKPIWDMISFTLSSVAELFAELMPEIMAFFQEAIAGIQDTWNNHLKPVFEAIGNFLNNILRPVFEFVFKTIIEPLITNVFDTIRRLWNGTLKPVFDGICDFLLGTFSGNWEKSLSGILNLVTGIFNAIRVAVEKPMDLIRDIVESAINFIKEKFNFDWELPDLKMPHFTISGSFSLNPLSVPSFGIDWYAKGGIMMNPTAFGINPTTGNLMVGGEREPEAIVPISTLKKYIQEAMMASIAAIGQPAELDYERMGEVIAWALEKAGLAVKIDNRVLGRIVREVAV